MCSDQQSADVNKILRIIDPFLKRHKLVQNGGFPKFEALYRSLINDKFKGNIVKPWLQGVIFQITKSETNSKVMMVFEYICHYGPVILLLCMTTLETGLYTNCNPWYSSTQGNHVYGPQENDPEDIRESFYHDVSLQMQTAYLMNGHSVILVSDFNVKLGHSVVQNDIHPMSKMVSFILICSTITV